MRFTNSFSRDLGVFTWAELQAAYPNSGGALAALPAGVTAFVSNWGAAFTPNASKTRWRPQGGQCLLSANGGSAASPIATLTGTTAAIFSLPGGMPSIPASLLSAGDALAISARCIKSGANGTASLVTRLGTAGTASDSDVFTVAYDNTSTRVISLDAHVYVASSSAVGAGAATNRGTDAIQTSIAAATYTTNINTAADMSLHFAVSAANASDTFNFLGYSVVLLSREV